LVFRMLALSIVPQLLLFSSHDCVRRTGDRENSAAQARGSLALCSRWRRGTGNRMRPILQPVAPSR
jgi:hypothetical protein